MKKRGITLIKLLIWIVVIIVIMSLLGYSLQGDVVNNPEVQSNFGYVFGLIANVWDTYLATPLSYFWNDIFVDIFWLPFLDNVNAFNSGDLSNIADWGPEIPTN